MTLFDFVVRILSAIILGLAIGAERQLTGHMAGIRINILVCLGTSMFVLYSQIMEAPDATRIAAQIVTGVGFLCSAIICKDGVNIRGLNTAATIWCTAAVGVLCSSGKLLYALAATLLLLAANILFREVANRVRPLESFDEGENTYRVTVVCPENKELGVRAAIIHSLSHTHLTLAGLESAAAPGEGRVEIEATLLCGGKRQDRAAQQLIEAICLEAGVAKAGWELV